MNRLPDWSNRLTAYIEQARNKPFAWGRHDCCQFLRKGIRALTGVDLARGLGLKRYQSHQGAYAQLKLLGGIEALLDRVGLTPVELLRAQRGDAVLCDFDGRPTLGIVVGEKAAFAGKAGLVFALVSGCRKAWRI